MKIIEDYDQILNIVRRWPAEQRLLLLREIRRTLSSEREQVHPPRRTLSKALGLVSTDRTPPSDEEVKSWLDQHRMEKYG